MRNLYMLVFALVGLPGMVSGASLDELVAECEGCHGPNGASSHGDVPVIGGQGKDFIDDTLRSFQVWGRPCIKSQYRHGDTSRPKTDMCKIAGGLTDEDITALSEHFSALPFVTAEQPFDAALAATGETLHAENCESCHAQGGSQADRGPRIAGQWTDYLRATLKFVPTGEHMVPPTMERKVSDFSSEEIDALMNYYASQQD